MGWNDGFGDSDDSDEDVYLDVEEIKHETDIALLVVVDDEYVWVPKSVIGELSEVKTKEDGSGTLIVPKWWAEDRGLI